MPEKMENKEQIKGPVTCAVILNKKGEILFIRRAKGSHQGQLALVSGTGFSKKMVPDQAVVEEVKFDLGTRLLNPKELFSMDVAESSKTDKVIAYSGTINESEIKLNPSSAEAMQWLSPEQAILLPLAFENVEIIKRYVLKKE